MSNKGGTMKKSEFEHKCTKCSEKYWMASSDFYDRYCKYLCCDIPMVYTGEEREADKVFSIAFAELWEKEGRGGS